MNDRVQKCIFSLIKHIGQLQDKMQNMFVYTVNTNSFAKFHSDVIPFLGSE